MDSKFCCVVIGLFFLTIIPTVIVQGIGCFHESLLHTEKCGDIGLFTECCLDHCEETRMDYIGPRKISDTAAVLQVTSFIEFLLIACVAIYLMCRPGDGEADNSRTMANCFCYFAILMYPISGSLCIVGCCLVAKFEDRSEHIYLGFAFYCCLIAGIYVMFQMSVCLCFWIYACCSRDSNMASSDDKAKLPPGVLATTQESGRMMPAELQKGTVTTKIFAHTGSIYEAKKSIIFRTLNLSWFLDCSKPTKTTVVSTRQSTWPGSSKLTDV